MSKNDMEGFQNKPQEANVRSGKDLTDFLEDIDAQIKQTGDEELRKFFEEAKITLTERGKELEELKKWRDSDVLDKEYLKYEKEKKQIKDSQPALTKDQLYVMDGIAARLAAKGTHERYLAALNKLMEQVQKGVQDSLERYRKRTETLKDILRFKIQEMKEDKTPQVVESYFKTLEKLALTKKAKLKGEGRQREESPSQADV